MRLLEGEFPEGKLWRVMILLSIGETPGVTWELVKKLVKSNNGGLVLAYLLSADDKGNKDQALQALREAESYFKDEVPTQILLAEGSDKRKLLQKVVDQGDIDFLIVHSVNSNWPGLNNLSCTVGAVRGEVARAGNGSVDNDDSEVLEDKPLRILLPTSAGPNTLHALNVLMPITNEEEVTALYIAVAKLGPSEEALGYSRLRQVLNFADAEERVESKLIVCDSVTEGIVDEAGRGHDLVVIGASQESTLDKALFGNVPAAVVRESRKPVMIIRQPNTRIGNLMRGLDWIVHRVVPHTSLSDRTEAYVRIRRGARPDFDFFALIGLATAIAALGLLADSAAVVIGAMLVAPLMSPIAGLGLAIILGDPRFLRLAVGAVLRGFLLALVVGFFAGLLPLEAPITSEVMARTQPTLLDLGVAIFSGMAVAYALCRLEAAAALPGVAIAAALVPPIASAGICLANGEMEKGLGALLLFATNLVAISIAAAAIFLVLGYRPAPTSKESKQIQSRSVRIALFFLIIITGILAVTTLRLAQDNSTQNLVRKLVEEGTAEYIPYASVFDLEITNTQSGGLDLTLTIRSTRSDIPHQAVVDLQVFIATQLQEAEPNRRDAREVGLNLVVIPATELDPFDPPTLTPTPTPTFTSTPGPTPTFTPTSTNTPTATPTNTPTFVMTDTPTPMPTDTPTPTPTDTPTPTATPRTAVVSYPFGLNLREGPTVNSDLLIFLEADTVVILLDEQISNDEGTWQQIQIFDLVGWVLADFITPQ